MSQAMPVALRKRYEEELDRGRSDSTPAGWSGLEAAHVLSQPWAAAHVRTHWLMLIRSIRERDWREMAGQIVRLVVAGPASFVGRYPVGNIGRARVKATMPMPVAADLAALLAEQRTPRRLRPFS